MCRSGKSVHNTCSRASLIMSAITESASSWLLLDYSPHDMTVDPFPAIAKSISFYSRYVCNFFAKKEVNCCFALVSDKTSFKHVPLISKASSTVNSTGTAYPRRIDRVEFFREICVKILQTAKCKTNYLFRIFNYN